MIATILLLAVSSSISSPYLGRFFDLAEWLGEKSVSSARTFGSVDATNATHRIDNDALKAVNALFEARCERVCDAWRGTNSVWDVSAFGPADDKRFRFGLADYHPTGTWDPDTNRAVVTRRFVDYENMRNLVNAIARPFIATGGAYLPYEFGIYRPGWRTDVVWSSTAFDGMRLYAYYEDREVVPEIPEFGWSTWRSVEKTPAEWAFTLVNWDNLRNPDVIGHPDHEFRWISFGGYPFEIDTSNPANRMIGSLHYSEPPFSSLGYIDEHVPGYNFATNTTEWVIGKMFEGGDVRTEQVAVDVIVVGDDMTESTMWAGEMSPTDMAYQELLFSIGQAEMFERAPFRVGFSLVGDPQIVPGIPSPFGPENALTWCQMRVDSIADRTGGVIRVSGSLSFFDKYITIPDDVNDDPIRFNLLLTDGASSFPASFEMSLDFIGPSIPRGYDLTRTDGPAETSYNFWNVSYDRPITNSLCKVHGLATIDTRRLVTDAVAGLGQCLSMLDRTYVDVVRDTSDVVLTNYYVTGMRDIGCDPQVVTLTCPSPTLMDYDPTVVGIIAFAGPTQTTFVAFGELSDHGEARYTVRAEVPHTGAILSRGCDALVYVSDRTSSATVDVSEDPRETTAREAHVLTFDLIEDDVRNYLANHGSVSIGGFRPVRQPDGDWAVECLDASGLNLICTIPNLIRPFVGKDYETRVLCDGIYTRQYYYAHYLPGDGRMTSMPYPADRRRVRTSRMWTMSSLATRRGDDGSTNNVSHVPVYGVIGPDETETMATHYSSHLRAFTAYADAVAVAQSFVEASVRAEVVVPYSDPARAIPLFAADLTWDPYPPVITRYRSTVSCTPLFSRAHGEIVRIKLDGVTSDVLVTFKDGTVATASDDLEVGIERLFFGSFSSPDGMEASLVAPRRIKGVLSAGKHRGVSVVDWDWGALRREKD